MFVCWLTLLTSLASMASSSEARPGSPDRQAALEGGFPLRTIVRENDLGPAVPGKPTTDSLPGLVFSAMSHASTRPRNFLVNNDVDSRDAAMKFANALSSLTSKEGHPQTGSRRKRLENLSLAMDAISCCKGDIFCMLRADCLTLHEDAPF